MTEKENQVEMHKQYFIGLITMMSMSAMQQLGKLNNPTTGKTETHLEAAQSTIDMLDMLDAKTSGNLDKDETKILKDTLSMLKLNYVETAEMEKGKTSEKEKPEVTEQTEQPPKENKDPKFHKSYE